MVDVGGRKAWLWNVMDGKTRYILATHLTPDRDANAARTVLRKAMAASDKAPDYFFSDKLRSYQPALRELLPKVKHYQSEGMTADINNNLSERLQGTFKDRIKTLRGLSLETGQRYLDGWVFTYNHFREHESLNYDTPGKRAKSGLPFKECQETAKLGPYATSKRNPACRLRSRTSARPQSLLEFQAAPVDRYWSAGSLPLYR